MVLIGYLAFLDPPKESSADAIRALKHYGVTTKILTGDNDKVTRTICKQVGLKVRNMLLGSDLEAMSDDQLAKVAESTDVFAKLTPDQKARVVSVLRENGHTVGFMGDGINDAAAMKAADIGISVDTAVDVAKESADIILLEKDLMVLEQGIIEGRKTYANMIKYIKMTASSNFGNMFSVLAASALLPFLPMMSVHLISLNLIYDLSCTAIPWDNVDEEFIAEPRKWDASSVGNFMIWIGPTSSIFDFATYLFMYFVFCPIFVSKGVLFNDLAAHFTGAELALMQAKYIGLFQAGWKATQRESGFCTGKSFHSALLMGCRMTVFRCGFLYSKGMIISYPFFPLFSCLLCKKGLDGLHGLFLLLLSRNGGRKISLLGAVVAKLGVVAALNLHNVLGVVDVILHALVQGAVDGQGLFIWIIAINVGAHQDKSVYQIGMV